MLPESYAFADDCINSAVRCDTGFNQILSTTPYRLDTNIYNSFRLRDGSIRDFQRRSLDIFRAALGGNEDLRILEWLMNDTPLTLGVKYHRSLSDEHFSAPAFFRTDEALPGRVLEIQCPGSLWGELQILSEIENGRETLHDSDCLPGREFGRQLEAYLGRNPVVHHLLDNASGQPAMRYFIQCTRPHIQYYTLDKGVRAESCNFIRSHSFFGLVSENYFKERLSRARARGLYYDLPPHVLFDQKATLALPFWSLTRKYFSDDIRACLVHTVPLSPDGIELEDGGLISIEQFCNLPRRKRGFYLKYGGSDVSINWGSKSVYRLSNLSSEKCKERLLACLAERAERKAWVIQKEEKQDDDIEYVTRDAGVCKRRMRAKFSGFYGPLGLFGVLAMHRGHNKVHGQSDTVIGLALPNEGTNGYHLNTARS